jgi:hypothetical protein
MLVQIQQRLADWRKSLHFPRAEPRTSLRQDLSSVILSSKCVTDGHLFENLCGTMLFT